MILGVVGGRDQKGPDVEEMIYKKLDELHLKHNIVKIISGKAPGVDTIAVQWAKDHKIEYKEYEPKWTEPTPGVPMKKDRYGRLYNPVAPLERNTIIVEKSTHILAFWDGKSTGTADTVRKSRKKNNLLEIVPVISKKNS